MATAFASMRHAEKSTCRSPRRSCESARRARRSARYRGCCRSTKRWSVRRTWAPSPTAARPVRESPAHDRGLQQEIARLFGELGLYFLVAARGHGHELHARRALEEHGEVGRLFYGTSRRQQAMVGEQDGLRVAEGAGNDAALV